MSYTTTPKVPYTHLTSNQRVELAALVRVKVKLKDIARQLGKAPSSITRELQRNGNSDGYRAITARRRTKERRISANKRFRKIENNERLRRYTVNKLKKCWSPEQIAGRLKKEYGKTVVCHETVYQWIYKEENDLKKYLRCRKGRYRRRYGTKECKKAKEEAKKKRIDIRPDIVERRERIGDWEGDTIRGLEKKIAILTHVERRSGYLLADKLEHATAEQTKEIAVKRFKLIPKKKRHTITYDNGSEFSFHDMIEDQTKTEIYFAYPYHAWERGANENANGLLRQFFPKKMPFRDIRQREIQKAVYLINTRPRKRLSYLTPCEVFKNKSCTLD